MAAGEMPSVDKKLFSRLVSTREMAARTTRTAPARKTRRYSGTSMNAFPRAASADWAVRAVSISTSNTNGGVRQAAHQKRRP